VGFFVEQGYISRTLLDVTLYLLAVGFPAMLLVVWFHGRPGRRRIGRGEAGVLALAALEGD